MIDKFDLTKVASKLKSGDVEELKRLRARVDKKGNEHVEVASWSLDYNTKSKQLISILSLKSKLPGELIICVQTGMKNGDAVIAGSLSQMSELSVEKKSTYSGWLYCDYTPVGTVTITTEVAGTVQLADGTGETFDFNKSITIGG